MSEAMISTGTVRRTADGRALQVIATIDEGEVRPGMFIHIPLNGMLNFTIRINEVLPAPDCQVRLILECGDSPDLVMAFNFDNDQLQVRDTGEV